jgi:peptidylprolyl isomerase
LIFETLVRRKNVSMQDIPAEEQAKAREILKSIESSYEGLSAAIENKDVPAIIASKRGVLRQIGDVEQLMVKAFPYE